MQRQHSRTQHCNTCCCCSRSCQLCVLRRDVDYWWDYDATVSEALEQGLANNELVTFSWNWGQLKNGKISEYVADPCSGIVRNLQNSREKRLRRVLVADM